MIKNNKGYLLAETIIAITVIATAITMVYAVSLNNYVNQDNEITKYNTTDGLYVLKEVYKYINIEKIDKKLVDQDCKELTNQISNIKATLNIHKLFYCNNNVDSITNQVPYQIKDQIKKIDTTDGCKNRYIIIMKSEKEGYSFATLGDSCIKESN